MKLALRRFRFRQTQKYENGAVERLHIFGGRIPAALVNDKVTARTRRWGLWPAVAFTQTYWMNRWGMLVSQTFTSWNQVAGWLCHLDGLRKAG